MVVHYYENPDFQKKKNSHKKFREILTHKLEQPLLGKQVHEDYVLPGPGRNSVSHETRLKGKHFLTRVEKRSRCTVCGYKRNRNFCKKCNKFVCKHCFERFHTQSNI